MKRPEWRPMKFWSRNDKFAFFGVLLAAFGVIGAVFPQEIRRLAGLHDSPPAVQSSIVTAPAIKAGAPAPDDLTITSLGDRTVITILAAKTSDQETASPVLQKGQNLKNTYYLGAGKHAAVSMTGQHNTLILAPEVKGRVAVRTIGDGAKIRTLGG